MMMQTEQEASLGHKLLNCGFLLGMYIFQVNIKRLNQVEVWNTEDLPCCRQQKKWSNLASCSTTFMWFLVLSNLLRFYFRKSLHYDTALENV